MNAQIVISKYLKALVTFFGPFSKANKTQQDLLKSNLAKYHLTTEKYLKFLIIRYILGDRCDNKGFDSCGFGAKGKGFEWP